MRKSGTFVTMLVLGVTWGQPLHTEQIPVRSWTAPPTWAATGEAEADADLNGRSGVAGEDAIASLAAVPTQPLVFTGVTPCRVADTRDGGFPTGYGPPSMPSSAPRGFTMTGRSGIPSSAQAVSVNFTVTNTLGPGFLLAFPAGGALTAIPGVSGFDLIIDVNGYYAPSTGGSRTVLVGPVGLEMQNGAALVAALAGITTASAGNPWLVKIEPSIYNVGTTPLAMKPYIDVEGSGEGTTTILGNTSGGAPSTGTVVGASNAELRSLTVQSAGANVHVAVFASGARLTHVTATATGGNYPIGVYSQGGNPILTRVTMNSSGSSFGAAFYNVFGSPTLVSSSATASHQAVVNDRGSLTIRNSVLSGGTVGISTSTDNGSPGSFLVTVDGSKVSGGTNSINAASATGSIMTVLVGASQLAGGPVTGTGTVRCVGVYDANYSSPGYTACA